MVSNSAAIAHKICASRLSILKFNKQKTFATLSSFTFRLKNCGWASGSEWLIED